MISGSLSNVHVHQFLPIYEIVTVPEKSHVVHHEAQYSTVHHEAVTHTVHHDAVYNTVWHDAVTHQEPVYEWHTFCSHCSMESPSFEHMLENDCGYYSSQVQTGEMTVTDQAAWEEQVEVSPAFDEVIVDQAAYDEQVLISPAWDETVVDQAAQEVQSVSMYRCSCGAVQ